MRLANNEVDFNDGKRLSTGVVRWRRKTKSWQVWISQLGYLLNVTALPVGQQLECNRHFSTPIVGWDDTHRKRIGTRISGCN